MRAPTKVTVYVAGLAVAFVGAFGVGSLTGNPLSEPDPHQPHADHASPTGATAESPRDAAESAQGATGLMSAAAGYRMSPVDAPSSPAEPGTLAFQIIGPDGAPVTSVTDVHERPMHLLIVRSDTAHYRHVHPELGPDGTWTVQWQWPAAGSYRVFADFAPTALGEGLTLSRTVEVAGDYQPSPPPSPPPESAAVARVGDFTVTLDGDLRAGQASTVTARVARDGQPVTELEPYLGAAGHLVAVRAGDLAYLHVHPTHDHDHDGGHGPAAEIGFQLEPPTAGTYRLFLDFQVGGEVHTAEFTVPAAYGDEGAAG